jgi:hypothetical protein
VLGDRVIEGYVLLFPNTYWRNGAYAKRVLEESRYFSRKRIDGFELGYKIASIWKFFEMAKLGWICVHAWTVGWSW